MGLGRYGPAVFGAILGIDPGTTNSAVAAMEGGKPTIAVVNPENTFFSVKRFIGRKMSEVDEESKQVSHKVVRDENGNVKLECPATGKQFPAKEISAQVY
ncbi:STROMAL 70 KDA HEAT SHOCK-RELATED PROTEIN CHLOROPLASTIC-LIKE [Salix purpurea]|uniref:STROMAL 70 kDa HEAT SHOCK-RELATED PROTEIN CHLOROPLASTIC-LIKE n=1 Tax=Salix purpurea TaxID=77065 RepID=A0A9Q0T242_SALPP|nr:STROMAL 70 KDA HEAT SHOCK-RELATED PROTEIN CHLOROPLASTIC-LIKE [Salix purpurea]